MWVAQMMALWGMVVVIRIVCSALGQKHIGQMIMVIALFSSINLTIGTFKPYWDDAVEHAKSTQQQLQDTKKSIDKAARAIDKASKKVQEFNEESLGEKISRFLWGDGKER